MIREIVSEIPHYIHDKEPIDDKTLFRQTWINTIKKEKVQPLRYYRPTTVKELQDIVMDAEAHDLMVRAVGKGHSFSDVANATDYLVDMLTMKKELDLEQNTFREGVDSSLFYRCEAGMMVEDLNANLDKKGLAIPSMAAFDQETIYGAIATSTHGTGIRIPAMPEMVQSFDLISAKAQKYRVEPSNGVTDPNKFDEPNTILIQDDDKFYSTVVGFGLMGIVYGVLLKVEKTYYLRQKLWVTNWRTVKQKLIDKSLFSDINPKGEKIEKDPSTGEYYPTRMQVFVNPYQLKSKWDNKKDNTCVVQIQTEISKGEYEKLKDEIPEKPSKLGDFIEEILSNGSHGVHSSSVIEEDKPSFTEELSANFLLHFLNKHPKMAPIINEIAVLAVLSGSGKIGKSFEVMNQGKLAFKNAGYSAEPGLAVEGDTYISAVEEIIRVLDLSAKSDAYLTAPLCLRFTKDNPFYLSPEYGRDTCMIEIPMLIGTTGGDELLDRMQKKLVKIGARPHWGKVCNMINGKNVVREMYPKFDDFVDTVTYFNPNGTFNSVFSYRTGFTDLVKK